MRVRVCGELRRAACALALGLIALGCGGEDQRPHVVLVVIDTLRADHLGVYGYARPTSPVIDGLAARGTVFTNATAPSSWTRPSVASLFTSLLPSEHGAVSIAQPLDAGVDTLTERLSAAGYRTVGVSGNFVHVGEQSGLARGFDRFAALPLRAREADDVILRLEQGGERPPVALRAPTAAEVNQRVLRDLPEPDGRPLFLYVHYMDPHSGYLAPEAFRARFIDAARAGAGPAATSDYVVELAAGRVEADAAERERLVALYDAEVAYVDAQLGLLLEGLAERGLSENALLVVTSDHGEEFAEHGGWFHGQTLHRELLRVPLIVLDPRRARGERSDEPVDLLDVAPTLLARVGLEPGEDMRGRALLGPEPIPPRARIAELHRDPLLGAHLRPRRHRLSLSIWPWKAIVARNDEVLIYQQELDPGEQSPLAATDPAVPAELAERALEHSRALAAAASPDEPQMSDEQRDALRALGYVD